jgi:hypothetical protein
MSSRIPDKQNHWLMPILKIMALAILLGMIVFSGVSLRQVTTLSPASLMPQTLETCHLAEAGYLRGRLYGALTADINWHGTSLTCDGLPRPGGDGIRLFFSNSAPDEKPRLVVVIGITGVLQNLAGSEHDANVTLVDGAGGRIFSSGGKNRCWTTVAKVTDAKQGYRVEGTVYCSGALPALNDTGSVTLGEFQFAGRLHLKSL